MPRIVSIPAGNSPTVCICPGCREPVGYLVDEQKWDEFCHDHRQCYKDTLQRQYEERKTRKQKKERQKARKYRRLQEEYIKLKKQQMQRHPRPQRDQGPQR